MNTAANTIASTIFAQLGNRALVMWGAKNLIAHADGASFKVGRNAKKVTHVTVKLNGLDLYDVTFHNVTKRGLCVREIATVSNVGVENLRDVIVDATGMYASI